MRKQASEKYDFIKSDEISPFCQGTSFVKQAHAYSVYMYETSKLVGAITNIFLQI